MCQKEKKLLGQKALRSVMWTERKETKRGLANQWVKKDLYFNKLNSLKVASVFTHLLPTLFSAEFM